MNDESDAFWHCICVVSENKINTNGKNVHGCTIIRLKQQIQCLIKYEKKTEISGFGSLGFLFIFM